MAALSAARRKRLPASAFVYPRTRSYPIDTVARAKNALARAASKRTGGSYATVARKVRAKYGNRVASVGKARGTVTRPGYKRTGGATRRTAARRGGGSRKR